MTWVWADGTLVDQVVFSIGELVLFMAGVWMSWKLILYMTKLVRGTPKWTEKRIKELKGEIG
jgi:uncharacterized membrane protein